MKIAKKIVSMCLALAMIVTTFAVNTVDVKAEETSEPRCTVTIGSYSNSEGIVYTTLSSKKAGNYELVYCYNGIEGPYRSGGMNKGNDSEEASSANFSMFIGNYFANVSTGDEAEITAKVYVGSEVVATSDIIKVTLANQRLAQVTNLRIDGNTIAWDAVEEAVKYKVSLYKKTVNANGNTVYSPIAYGINVDGCSYDFASYASETERISVTACSGDYSKKLDSTELAINIGSTTNPSNPTPPSTGDSNSSNDSSSSSESGSVASTYAPTDADIYEQQMKEKEAKYKKAVTGADGKEVTSSINGVYEVNTMAGTAVKSAKADVAKAVLTEDEIQNGTNTSIYMSDGLSKEVKDSLKNVASANGKTVLTMFMADMYKISKAGEVIKTNNLKENIEMVFGIPSYAVDANRTYSVLCVTPDGRTIEFKDMDNDPSTITLNANVLGNYAVVF